MTIFFADGDSLSTEQQSQRFVWGCSHLYELYLQILGSMLAIIGALANCSPNRESKLYGFGVWIFSNAIIGVWAACTGNWWLLGMYLVFMATSTRGFWSHRK